MVCLAQHGDFKTIWGGARQILFERGAPSQVLWNNTAVPAAEIDKDAVIIDYSGRVKNSFSEEWVTWAGLECVYARDKALVNCSFLDFRFGCMSRVTMD